MRLAAVTRCALTATLVVVAVSALFAQQADRARTEALAKRATDRLAALHQEADRLASSERSILNELRQMDVARQIKAEELRQIQSESADVSSKLGTTSERADRLQQAERAARPELETRLAELYKLGQGRYLRLLLSTTDLRQVGQASRTIGVLAKLDADRIADYRRTLQELGAARVELARRQTELQKLRAEATAAQAELARSIAARDERIRQIDEQRDLNARLVSDLRNAQVRLQQTLRDLASGASTGPAALPIAPFRGDLPWPADGKVERKGRAALPGGTPAEGIEIAASEGAPVVAVHDGSVAFAGSFSGFGNLVILDHGSRSFTLYGDLLDLAVSQGDRVDRGQRLGSVGTLPAGPAGLYFEIRIDGRPVDPLQWLTSP